MTITVTPTPEQQDALAAVVATANAELDEAATPYTAETYLAMLLDKALVSYAKTAYDAAGQRILSDFQSEDYAKRSGAYSVQPRRQRNDCGTDCCIHPMNKTQLIEEIEAYASAKGTGNMTLIQRSAVALKSLLDKLPEELLKEDKTD